MELRTRRVAEYTEVRGGEAKRERNGRDVPAMYAMCGFTHPNAMRPRVGGAPVIWLGLVVGDAGLGFVGDDRGGDGCGDGVGDRGVAGDVDA